MKTANTDRARRILDAIAPVYDEAEVANIRDALADLRHACDLLGLSYAHEDRIAYRNYAAEVAEGGFAG